MSEGYVTCSHGAVCTNNVGGYACTCNYGFKTHTGLVGDIHCLDINECIRQNACQGNAGCRNTQGSYICDCFDGYAGDLCEDIDECTGKNECHSKAQCQNTEGNYTCSCNEGFFGSGYYCVRGQCQDSFCPDNQKCVSATTEECKCKEGFQLNNDFDCVDIDECGYTGCNEQAECTNTIGSYACTETRIEQIYTTSTTSTTTTTSTKQTTTALTTVQTTGPTTQESINQYSSVFANVLCLVVNLVFQEKNKKILVLNSQYGWKPAMLINSAGEQKKLTCFERDGDTEAYYSCSITWKNQFHVFGGYSYFRQISRLNGYKLERIGSLDFLISGELVV